MAILRAVVTTHTVAVLGSALLLVLVLVLLLFPPFGTDMDGKEMTKQRLWQGRPIRHRERPRPAIWRSKDSAADPVQRAAEEMAEFAYQNQIGERETVVSLLLASYGANWPCFWGEDAVGDLKTFEDKWESGPMKDGWKYACGVRKLRKDCVVYSLGSSGNMAFEKNLLSMSPWCEIHTFDRSLPLEQLHEWIDPKFHAHTHEVFIAARDDTAATPPRRSLTSIMAEEGHKHIDILKMDIEGSEWGVLLDPAFVFPSVGQLLLEVHLGLGYLEYCPLHTAEACLAALMKLMEDNGLRLFHKEVNYRYDPLHCIEFSFIQREYRPSRDHYSARVIAA